MADPQNANLGVGLQGAPSTNTISFQSLIAALQAGQQQMSTQLNTLNGNVKGLGLIQFVSAPATATSAGVAGQLAYQSGYFYVCVATNSWQRVAIAAW